MRRDIAKVICERPRKADPSADSANGAAYHRTREGKVFRRHLTRHTRKPIIAADILHGDQTGEDDQHDADTWWSDLDMPLAPLQEKTARFARQFTDRLGALRGWARQQVGRPWNKAYSELRALIPGDSTTQRHVLGHVRDFIIPAEEIEMVAGWPFRARPSSRAYAPEWYEEPPLPAGQKYVDPRNGVVCVARDPDPARQLRPLDHRKVTKWVWPNGNDDTELYWHAGRRVWIYRYTVRYRMGYSSELTVDVRERLAGRRWLRMLGFRQVRD